MIVYAVNSYVTRLLQQELEWTPVNNLIPVVPAQQIPELMNGGKPFMAYMWSEEYNSGDPSPVGSGILTYAIYAKTVEQVNDAAQLIFDAFTHEDSAYNMNSWIQLNSPLTSADKKHTVSSTEGMNMDSAGAVESEGGRYPATVQVRVRYIRRDIQDFSIAL